MNMKTKPAMPIHIPYLVIIAGTARNLFRKTLMPLLITGNGQYLHQLRTLTTMEKMRKGHQTDQTRRLAGLFFCGPKRVYSIIPMIKGTLTNWKPN